MNRHASVWISTELEFCRHVLVHEDIYEAPIFPESHNALA